ncbi:DUF2471 family protein [Cupriavidus basilensis]|uniref:DUF2471 family protein n=1 Tax=Cupriavidus basilensis TaxID=68895 RepID=UPI002845EB46|nr:DUF2471 family protein [Cupriavidus basilensis]MDR3381716.1 DUF2471 family protein [Cupriavidus basilensis]
MLALAAAESAIIEALPPIIARHREAGVLTWRLIHQIEEEVLAAVAAIGLVPQAALGMVKAPAILGYPKDDRPVDFTGHDVRPITFGVIVDAWQRVH